jgi:HK97 family phage prohead protease
MNRSDILGFDTSYMRRDCGSLELRADSGGMLVYEGYASTTEQPYDVYGGPPFGWNETIVRGGFKRTLANNADVAFLVNHEGMNLARTKAGTLQLTEDDRGLHVRATMNPEVTAVRDLQLLVEDGNIDEMSFGFRVDKDEWYDEDGERSNEMVGTERRITEINLNKGDVSAVNYGANPNTTGKFRAADMAFAELRAGREVNGDQARMIVALARILDDDELEQREQEFRAIPGMEDHLSAIEAACGGMRDLMSTGDVQDPSMNSMTGKITLGRDTETLAAMRALWEMKKSA